MNIIQSRAKCTTNQIPGFLSEIGTIMGIKKVFINHGSGDVGRGCRRIVGFC